MLVSLLWVGAHGATLHCFFYYYYCLNLLDFGAILVTNDFIPLHFYYLFLAKIEELPCPSLNSKPGPWRRWPTHQIITRCGRHHPLNMGALYHGTKARLDKNSVLRFRIKTKMIFLLLLLLSNATNAPHNVIILNLNLLCEGQTYAFLFFIF